jgi:hypothetical protein
LKGELASTFCPTKETLTLGNFSPIKDKNTKMNITESEKSELSPSDEKKDSDTDKLIKKTLAIVIASAFIIFTISFVVKDTVSDIINTQKENLTFLRGGRAFWANVEQKLYSLADEQDIEPERKKKVVEALRKLSLRYRPYFQALNGEEVNIEIINTATHDSLDGTTLPSIPIRDLKSSLEGPPRR